jgi:protein gp37
MADGTKIEWADATLNYVNGCSVLSPGCTNCYAMRLAGTRMRNHPSRAGLTQDSKAGPVWTGEVRAHAPALLQALAWKRPRRIFWNAHGDLFHENVPDEWIDRLFAVCALTPHHTHMILTKRSARMRDYASELVRGERSIWSEGRDFAPGSPAIAKLLAALDWGARGDRLRKPLQNVWLGVSIEDQQRADERVPDLLATPAVVRFVSAEPLLDRVDLTSLPVIDRPLLTWDALTGQQRCGPLVHADTGRLHLVIVGGESGPRARPMDTDWARSLRDQCEAAGVAFHFKQHGEWIGVDTLTAEQRQNAGDLNRLRGDPLTGSVWLGKRDAGRLLDGRTHDNFPTPATEARR